MSRTHWTAMLFACSTFFPLPTAVLRGELPPFGGISPRPDFTGALVAAGEPSPTDVALDRSWTQTDPFGAWRSTLQFTSGPFFTSKLGPGLSPWNMPLAQPIDYTTFNLRLGCMMPELPPECIVIPGNFELLVELSSAAYFRGFGSGFIGPSMLVRYNIFDPLDRSCVVPYMQAGAGIVFTDSYRDPYQRAIGQCQEFLLQAGFGVRYLVNANWSLDLEGGFQHISNAGIADRNGGINTFGGAVGLTYYFGCN